MRSRAISTLTRTLTLTLTLTRTLTRTLTLMQFKACFDESLAMFVVYAKEVMEAFRAAAEQHG